MRKRGFVVSTLVTGAGLAAACQDPTEITVRITTGESCNGEFTGAAITTGPSLEEADRRFTSGYVAATTHQCEGAGLVGTLVMTPGDKSGSVIVAGSVKDSKGNTVDPSACGDPKNSALCIVARRTFTFVSHRALILPIDLDPRCLGKTCDTDKTCFQGGCVDQSVTCVGSFCGLPQENPGDNGLGTGSADASMSSDGAYDAEMPDGTMSMVDNDGSMTTVDGSDGSMGTTVDSGTDSAAGLPACTVASPGASGNGWIATCNATAGEGVDTCIGGNSPPHCCHCACVDMNGAGHGSITCASTSSCGSGCMN